MFVRILLVWPMLLLSVKVIFRLVLLGQVMVKRKGVEPAILLVLGKADFVICGRLMLVMLPDSKLQVLTVRLNGLEFISMVVITSLYPERFSHIVNFLVFIEMPLVLVIGPVL